MRRRFVYDHTLECLVEITHGSNRPVDEPSRMQIISDIEPYRPVASDIGSDGKRPVISGRRQHREFLRRNNYIETGNEKPISGERPVLSREERIQDIRRAMRDW